MVPHPWLNGRAIELMADGSVREVCVDDGRVAKTYEAMYADIYGSVEILALCAPRGEFFLLVCYGNTKQPWRVFSSATDNWSGRHWPRTCADSNTAFFDPLSWSVYYRVEGQDNWMVVRGNETRDACIIM